MSWAEVKKLNSDFTNEPLNFNNYVNDIATFGAASYVLDGSNTHLWRQLLQSSLSTFGSSSIHTVVYNRFTDPTATWDPVNNDTDYMLNSNSRLGQCLNAFYATSVFSDGNIDAVLKTMTNAHFNLIEPKIQKSICRYLTYHTSGSSGVGEWLATVYAEPTLSSYATLSSILGNLSFWASGGILATNEPLRVGCCSSSVGIEYVGTQSSAAWFNDYVNTVSETTVTTTELWDQLQANSALATFWQNSTASGYVFDKAPSMTALIYHPYAFKELCGSTAGIATLCNHTSQYTVLFNGWNTAGLSESTLNTIRSNITTLQTNVATMPSDSHNINDIATALAATNYAILTLQNMNSKADVLAENFDALYNSEVAWSGLTASDSAMLAISQNSVACTKIATSTMIMDKIISSVVAMKQCLTHAPATQAFKANTSIAWPRFIGTTATNTVKNNASLLNTLKAHAQYTNLTTSHASQSGYGGAAVYSATSYQDNVFMLTGQTNGGVLELKILNTNAYRDVVNTANVQVNVNEFGRESRLRRYAGGADGYGYGGAYRYSGSTGVHTSITGIFKMY